jgi:hypothetical protein
MELLDDVAHVESCFGPFKDCVWPEQDRCMICAEHTTSLETVLEHPMELLDDVAHVESCFGPFKDCVWPEQDRCMICAKRTLGSEIVLDGPNGTPR